jgi:vacuolar protein sorting-associated protein 72
LNFVIVFPEDTIIKMSLAATRDKRSKAGNRMSKLLDEEEEDDFYKTTYGGFAEIENDDDYQ